MDIPGYYYDKEKKKYFKIQASGAAPATSAYSSQDVKRRKTRDERAGAQERAMTRARGRIKRSKILAKPLYGGFLARENGEGSLDTAHILAKGLVPQGCFCSLRQFSHCSAPLFALVHRPDIPPSASDIFIAYDDTLFLGQIHLDSLTRAPIPTTIEILRFGRSGASTSMCTSENNKLLAMTWLSPSSQAGIGISAMGNNRMNMAPIVLGPGTARGRDVDVLSSTSAPPSSSLLFAFGTSQGILSLDKRNYDMTWATSRPRKEEPYYKDVFALEFLVDNPSVLLSGGRPGLLSITDLREPLSEGKADFIRHPSSITHIKSLDGRRILVAGLNSSLCQYDLRFRKSNDTGPIDLPRNTKSYPHYNKPTRSLLAYPDYRNYASTQLGFDVDLESGIIAAAQEQEAGHLPVQLFSLHGGKKITSPYAQRPQSLATLSESWDNENATNAKCVRFATDIEGRMKSLYVGAGHDIQRFAWAPAEDADLGSVELSEGTSTRGL